MHTLDSFRAWLKANPRLVPMDELDARRYRGIGTLAIRTLILEGLVTLEPSRGHMGPVHRLLAARGVPAHDPNQVRDFAAYLLHQATDGVYGVGDVTPTVLRLFFMDAPYDQVVKKLALARILHGLRPDNRKLLLAATTYPKAVLRLEYFVGGGGRLVATEPAGLALVPQDFDWKRREDLDRVFRRKSQWFLSDGILRRFSPCLIGKRAPLSTIEIRLTPGFPFYPPVPGSTSLRCLVGGVARTAIDTLTAWAVKNKARFPLSEAAAGAVVRLGPDTRDAMAMEGLITLEPVKPPRKRRHIPNALLVAPEVTPEAAGSPADAAR
jgi:hypothetical protein